MLWIMASYLPQKPEPLDAKTCASAGSSMPAGTRSSGEPSGLQGSILRSSGKGKVPRASFQDFDSRSFADAICSEPLLKKTLRRLKTSASPLSAAADESAASRVFVSWMTSLMTSPMSAMAFMSASVKVLFSKAFNMSLPSFIRSSMLTFGGRLPGRPAGSCLSWLRIWSAASTRPLIVAGGASSASCSAPPPEATAEPWSSAEKSAGPAAAGSAKRRERARNSHRSIAPLAVAAGSSCLGSTR
mmetsp:Transcript_11807/g.34468  ORF Transcript_11807/g.34468 Transcript_11807/m.34468 type:complete len:244 (-) Transcript_11807:15-746(-)